MDFRVSEGLNEKKMKNRFFGVSACLLALLICDGTLAAAPGFCQPEQFELGASRFKMADGADVQIQAWQCDRAAQLRGKPGSGGFYLAYKLLWRQDDGIDESYFGDLGRSADSVLALQVKKVDERTLAVIESAERGGLLYVWHKPPGVSAIAPYVLDFVGYEDSSLCFAAQGAVVSISHCRGTKGKSRLFGPVLKLEWQGGAPGWRIQTPQSLRAFTDEPPALP